MNTATSPTTQQQHGTSTGSFLRRVQGQAHDDLSREGTVRKVTGTLTLDESNLANSRVEALIEAGSLETRDASAMRT